MVLFFNIDRRIYAFFNTRIAIKYILRFFTTPFSLYDWKTVICFFWYYSSISIEESMRSSRQEVAIKYIVHTLFTNPFSIYDWKTVILLQYQEESYYIIILHASVNWLKICYSSLGKKNCNKWKWMEKAEIIMQALFQTKYGANQIFECVIWVSSSNQETQIICMRQILKFR